jgi:nucleolar protein 58
MMRLREWYGWHFPELSKIITDNHVYAKAVKKIGKKTNASTAEFEGILPEEVEKEVR